MIVEKTELDKVLLFKPEIFEDFRGEYIETFNEKEYNRIIKEFIGEEIHFVVDDISVSKKDVLRGIHGDDETWKLVSCLSGSIYLVVVNCNTYWVDSVTGYDYTDTFGKWIAFSLSDKNRQQVLVPPKHGIAILVLSEKAIFHYKQSTYYDPEKLKQFTYRFDDPRFNIWWPDVASLLSQRDELGGGG